MSATATVIRRRLRLRAGICRKDRLPINPVSRQTTNRSKQVLKDTESTHSYCSTVQLQYRSRPGLSQKYQPKIFEDMVGHAIIMKALLNAVQTRRISPLYLFHGPGGSGKTSAAKVLARALNCESTSPSKPCLTCRGCSQSEHNTGLRTKNQTSSFDNVKTLIHSTTSKQTALIIDECQLLPDDSWNQLLDIMEQDKNSCLVYIVVVRDVGDVPRAVSSRCLKFSFPKLKDADITLKLAKIVEGEGIHITNDAVKLIAKTAEGNLREAENLLDRMALVGQMITVSMVEQLVGLIPHEKLVPLLGALLHGDSIEAVRSTNDLITYCIEPKDLVLQLASFIGDIISDASCSPMTVEDPIRFRNIHPERLYRALKILVDTEKQLRTLSSCNNATWVTAAMLWIASDDSFNCNSTSMWLPKHVSRADDDSGIASRKESIEKDREQQAKPTERGNVGHHQSNHLAEHSKSHTVNLNTIVGTMNMEEVWHNILHRMQNKSLEDLLTRQSKLLSLTVSRANVIVHLMFTQMGKLSVPELSEESISNALETVVGCPVTIKMSCEPTKYGLHSGNNLRPKMLQNTGHTLLQKNVSNRGVHRDSTSKRLHVLSSFVDPEMNLQRSKQFPDETPIKKETERKHKFLLVSPFPNTDATIEPYSQDLLFETAKIENQRQLINSKSYNDQIKSNKDRHNMDYMGLTQSWSWTEKLCRGQTMVEDNTKGRGATEKYVMQRTLSYNGSTHSKVYKKRV